MSLAEANRHGAIVADWMFTALPMLVEVGELADNTLRAYHQAANKWLAFLAGRQRPTPANIMAWLAGMRAAGNKVSTISTYLAAIKSFYRWTESQELYPNIARSIKSPRNFKDSPLPAPSTAEISAMFHSIPTDSIQGKRARAMLAVMFATALRCVSLLRATVGDVDFQTGTIRHQPKGHREKDGIAVLSNTAREALVDYLAARGPLRESDPLFAPTGNRRSRSGALTTKSMRSVIMGLTEAAGLARRNAEGKIANPGHYGPHSLRRAAVTQAAEMLGMDAAQTLAGHASSDTTRRAYARTNRFRQLQATAKILDL